MKLLLTFLTTALLAAGCQESTKSTLASDPVTKSFFFGDYSVKKDLENPDNDKLPKRVGMYYDAKLKIPVVYIKWNSGKVSKFNTGEHYHTGIAGSDEAKIYSNNKSKFDWRRRISPPTDGSVYIDEKTFIEFKSTDEGLEFEYTKQNVVTRYKTDLYERSNPDEKPSVDKTTKTRRYLIESVE